MPQPEQALGQTIGLAEQPLYGSEIEPVGLQVQDQAQPGHVLGVVVAHPCADLWRRQEPPCVVVSDVPDGHPRQRGQLLDGQVVCRLGLPCGRLVRRIEG